MKLKQLGLFLFLFFIIVTKPAFAADFQVSGKIIDDRNNPIPNGVITFTNADGKTIQAATANSSGMYQASVPAGTYSITVTGPKGSTVSQITENNQTISGNSVRNFSLVTKSPEVAVKPVSKTIVYGAAAAIIAVILLGGYFFWRKRK